MKREEIHAAGLIKIEALIRRLEEYPKTPDRDFERRLLRLLVVIIIETDSENARLKISGRRFRQR